MSRSNHLGAVTSLPLLAAVLVSACSGDGGGQSHSAPSSTAAPGARPASPSSTDGASRFPDWPETDFTRVEVNLDQVIRGCPGRDCIPPLDAEGAVSIPGERGGQAKFVSVAEAGIEPQMPVAAVVVNGEARAYPLHILTWHEIVNDNLGGVPIAVTFCPLCNTAISFDRRVGDETLDFGVSGNLRNSDLIMWDRQTHSWWQQATGEGIVGTHAGALLKVLATSIISFQDFQSAYPGALVLSEDTGIAREYGINPYEGYDSSGSQPFLFDGRIDDRLDALERVATIEHEGDFLALPFSALSTAGVANVTVGSAPFAVFWSAGTVSALGAANIASARDVGAAAVFDPRLDGQTLTFTQAGHAEFRDDQTGSTWTITGRATEGSLAGKQLVAVSHTTQFWFAWAAFHPDTEIWEPS
ncbi:MAG: DUF3179 domain-containing protein [Dehalococcoidia bacterium]|nr:DUF3179 domain-containing protein [Dehalococcoidia bacterium]MCB9486966.1 DUF3179 domain-containing protein [Thermoflexaceae bacterium]